MTQPLKTLAINLRNKYFHNSVDWEVFCLQVYIPLWLAKILRFTVFRLLKNAFVKLPCPYHDLIINLHLEHSPPIYLPKQFVIHLPWKASLHTLWGKSLYPCSIGKLCSGVSINICKNVLNKNCEHIEFGKTDLRQNRSVSLPII